LAAPEENAGPGFEPPASGLGHQGGLAQAGLARDEDQLTSLARGHPLEGVGQDLGLGVAGDDTCNGHDLEAGRQRHNAGRHLDLADWLPSDLVGLDRLGQALELQLTERREGKRAPTSGHNANGVGGEDLAAFGLGAQPRRLDHRVTEVVVRLSGRFSAAEPDPQPQRSLPLTIGPVDTLLHRNRARQRGGGAWEYDHEPIAQGLHLGATRGGDGLA
jgi:hypothetical protein